MYIAPVVPRRESRCRAATTVMVSDGALGARASWFSQRHPVVVSSYILLLFHSIEIKDES
jgi:hypothetical protein